MGGVFGRFAVLRVRISRICTHLARHSTLPILVKIYQSEAQQSMIMPWHDDNIALSTNVESLLGTNRMSLKCDEFSMHDGHWYR